MAGSLVGIGFAAAGAAPHVALPAAAAILLPGCVAAARALPELHGEGSPKERVAIRRRPPSLALLGICLFAFGVTMTEGAVADWSAVFLRDVFAQQDAAAGFGYSAFAFMVAAGRFGGDRLKSRYGAVTLARACGVTSIAGLLLVVASPAAPFALVGFAATGLGRVGRFPPGRHSRCSPAGPSRRRQRGDPLLHRPARFSPRPAADRFCRGIQRHAPWPGDAVAGARRQPRLRRQAAARTIRLRRTGRGVRSRPPPVTPAAYSGGFFQF